MERNGTHYHDETPESIIRILEHYRTQSVDRIRIYYGTSDGTLWGDRPDEGYVRRSMGPQKIPILVHNRRSLGGNGILTHWIVRIETARGKRLIYQRESRE